MNHLTIPRFRPTCCYLFCFLTLLQSLFSNEPDRVVVVVNGNDSASVRIGVHYAESRGIPKENIISLATSGDETITLNEYVDQLANPLLEALIEDGWVDGVPAGDVDVYGRQRMALVRHNIGYLVLIRGIPLRIKNQPDAIQGAEQNLPKQFKVTHGSVDNELSILLGPPGASMTAFLKNPYFEAPSANSIDAQRVIFVSRLDGPSEASVIRLIDETLEAEMNGLVGRAYFDVGGPHAKGDEWLRSAGEMVEAEYYDTDFQSSRRVMDLRDRYDAPAIYMGWYRPNAYGPWREARWPVPPGAIGFHLHSFSATTVRSTQKAWLGAFVHQGYAATVGNVYEPYLEFTHRPDLLMRYLLEGHRFGDAVMWSYPCLSWQGVAIGDPLYRPFLKSLDDQLAQPPEGPFSGYLALRQANRLEAESGVDAALQYVRTQFVREPSLALSLRLANLYLKTQQKDRAIESLKYIRFLSDFTPDERIVVKEIADTLHSQGESDLAFQTYAELLKEKDLEKGLELVLLKSGVEVAEAVQAYDAVSDWSLRLRVLNAPKQ